METTKLRAAITCLRPMFPDYILTNDELSSMVDTSDEWIMSRVGIRERHILEAIWYDIYGCEGCQKRCWKKTRLILVKLEHLFVLQ